MGRDAADDASAAEDGAGPTLGTADQIARDDLAVRLFESDVVQAAIADLERYYAAMPAAALPDAERTIARAAAANAMAQTTTLANADVDRPAVFWSITTDHRWGALRVPASGMLLDCPDNVYRTVPIDGAARYAIRGRLNGPPPAQATFVLHGAHTGLARDATLRPQMEEVGAVSLDRLPLDADGGFAITVDDSPADGRPDHIRSRPGDRDGYLIVRDTLADWARERPLRLSAVRLGGPPLRPPLPEADLARAAAERLATVSRYWATWSQQMMLAKSVNTLPHGFARASGWGYAASGHYRIDEDEALLIRLDRCGAAYLGIQVADIWGQAAAYVDRPGSLNQGQARADADGGYTFVVALDDPGVANWIDPAGIRAGTFAARWQGLPAGASAADAVRGIERVRRADLRRLLPDETAWIGPDERAATLAARAESFRRRL